MECYVSNPEWLGDVSGALLPHPRMFMVPGIERKIDGPDINNSPSSFVANSPPLNGKVLYFKDRRAAAAHLHRSQT